MSFLAFAVLIPYLALHLPVVWGFSGLSIGASGLTKALTGYTVVALLVDFVMRVEGFAAVETEWREVVVALVAVLMIVFLTVNSWETIRRFAGVVPSPTGVSVASHFFGLVLGVLWFGWRAWRHGLFDET